MTALAANITATQTLVPVDAGLTNGSFQLPLYYTVDSEAVRVTGRAHRTTWLVERGIAGTTAASHSSAATLTRYYPEAASSGAGGGAIAVTDGSTTVNDVTSIELTGATVASGGAGVAEVEVTDGGEQVVSLLGPFRIDFDDAGITGAGVLATSQIPAGSLVVSAWAEIIVSWLFAEPGAMVLRVAPNSDPGDTFDITKYGTGSDAEITQQGDAFIGLEATTANISSVDVAPYRVIARCVEASRLTLATPAGVTQGQADVFVLIATPA